MERLNKFTCNEYKNVDSKTAENNIKKVFTKTSD